MPTNSPRRGFFRDPIWQFLGVVVAVIGIIVAYNIFYLQKQVKSLQFIIITNTSLVNIIPEEEKNITILYGDKHIKNAFLIEVVLENDGNIPITIDDYSRPIKIFLPEGYEIASVKQPLSSPDNILDTSQIDNLLQINEGQREITFPTVLLNPHDYVSFGIIAVSDIKNEAPNLSLDCRIVGIKDIAVISLSDLEAKRKITNDRLEMLIQSGVSLISSFVIISSVGLLYILYKYIKKSVNLNH